ncbi:hypothetical protein DPMN_035506 [Dreissena polymorpha]|uniref:Uncharacterized protein n=1 Tax=Dreissena polymorpha TaxID=45954 RepID=A0A9D4MBZ5_DREPO|nr:hypothetical protein DPMN_035506 [Dreissena polymorpha]
MLHTGTSVTVHNKSQSNMLRTGSHSPSCYALVSLSQSIMLRTSTIVKVQHATHWYHGHSPSCYALVPLSQSIMLLTGTIVKVKHAMHWYHGQCPI